LIQLQSLNYILLQKDASFLIDNNISEEFFSEYTAEYKFIREHFDKYGVIPDTATFISKFPDFDIIDFLSWTGKPHTDRRTGKTEIVVFNGFPQKAKQWTILREHPELIPPKIEVLERKDKTVECNQQMQDDVSAIQQEIINVKSLVKEVVFKEQGIENVRVCDLATRHKDAFKAFLEEKELASP